MQNLENKIESEIQIKWTWLVEPNIVLNVTLRRGKGAR